jgi:hypothetical protein
MLQRIVSGEQTGVDRAGLDAAIEAGISIGGCVPKGRLAEDGVVQVRYALTEIAKGGYRARTEKNVVESDGTLILNIGTVTGGTRLTVVYACKHDRPFSIVPLDEDPQPQMVTQWLAINDILTLNIAGPRESKFPQGIYLRSISLLRSVLIVYQKMNT